MPSRWLAIAVAFSSVLLFEPCAFSQGENQEHAKQSLADRNDPKCIFLRDEVRRLQQDRQTATDSSGLSNIKSIQAAVDSGKTIDDLAEFVAQDESLAARIRILTLAVVSCEKGQPLSDVDRLQSVELAKGRQIDQIDSRWNQLGGKPDDEQLQMVIGRVNGVYDDEAKSFYNSDSEKLSLDPDIVKDYPTLFSLIENSGLSPDQKTFFQQNAQFLKYEEAGRLFNILSGIDKVGSLTYAYSLRKPLSERAQAAQNVQQADSQRAAEETEKKIGGVMVWLGLGVLLLILLTAGVAVFKQSERYARYKGIRDKKQSVKYRWGTRTLILWEPGEVVILLKNKKLVSMTEPNGDPQGGFTSVSAWKGEEYRGRISYQSQLMQYVSEDIHTSDGVPVNLDLGLWWQIQNPNLYVARIAADYHLGNQHYGAPSAGRSPGNIQDHFDEVLKETAERWIRLMAGSSLREHVCEFSAAKLISPSVKTYIDTYFISDSSESKDGDSKKMPTIVDGVLGKLNTKTNEYGIRIERIEVNELHLPENLKQQLETVRLSFLEPAKVAAETQGRSIEKRGLTQGQIEALTGFADVLGKDKVALIEIIKAIGIAKIPFVAPQTPPFAMLQSLIASAQSDSASGQPVKPKPEDPQIDGDIINVDGSPTDENPTGEAPKGKAAGAG
jgi:regulator of protease activity HflC (stomatin/prohibitin superfamily)